MRNVALNVIKRSAGTVLAAAPESVREWYKETFELLFWRKHRYLSGGKFQNAHLEVAFTKPFGLDRTFFENKRILDIGCGPSGSLEWADNAAERVGVDPLADKYVRLNGGKHKMKYVNAGAEALPFDDQSFDVVSIFNALDHVRDVNKAIREAVRVCSSGGSLLLIVEINHKPTITEPHFLEENVLLQFAGCKVETKKVFAINEGHNVYQSVRQEKERKESGDPAIIISRLTKHAIE